MYRRTPRTVHRVVRDRVLVGASGRPVAALGGSAAVVFARLDVPHSVDELVAAVAAGVPAVGPVPDPAAVRDQVADALAVLVDAGLVEPVPGPTSTP